MTTVLNILMAVCLSVELVFALIILSGDRPRRQPAGWPPPLVWDDAALDRLLTAVLADPWGPPEPWTRQG